MRILIDYRPALRHRTGVGVWVYRLVEALATAHADGLDITAFSSSWRDRFTTALPVSVHQIDRRVPVRLLNWMWHRREWPPVELLATGPFDVVHSPSPLLIPTSGAARLVTIHDIDFLMHPERAGGEVRRDYSPLARAHAHRADASVVIPMEFLRLPVLAAAGYLLFDEVPDRWALVGAVIIFGATYYMTRNSGRR